MSASEQLCLLKLWLLSQERVFRLLFFFFSYQRKFIKAKAIRQMSQAETLFIMDICGEIPTKVLL